MASRPANLRAGLEVKDITPPVGVDLCGWAFGSSRGVLSPLEAHFLLLENDHTRLLLISVDVIAFDTSYADEVRATIANGIGLDVGQIMLAATHTHCGPATVSLRHWGKPDPDYLQCLQEHLIEGARRAVAALQPARIGTGTAFVRGIAVNRCFPDGPTDPSVAVVRVDDIVGTPIGLVLTFGCHPVNLHGYENMFSPDFPGDTRRWLSDRIPSAKSILCFASPSGDQNPLNFEPKQPSEHHARETGQRLARGVFEQVEKIRTRRNTPLQAVGATVKLPLGPLPHEADLEADLSKWAKCLADLEAAPDAGPPALARAHMEVDWSRAALAIKRHGGDVSQRSIELQAMRLGDAALIAVPAEIFVGVGSAIRDVSPFYHTLMITNANGTVGYIPTAEAFEQGRYETDRAAKHYGVYRFRSDVGDALVAGARTVFDKLSHEMRDRHRRRNPASRRMRDQALDLVVGGCQAHKAPRNLEAGMPAFVARAHGARFWDVDDNEYIDLLMSYGPIVLGHNHSAVDAAVTQQMKKGTIYDLEYPEMLQLSRTLIDLIPCAEMTAFFLGGSGATSGAIAMARSHTGREKIIRCGYHGWHPWAQPGRQGTPNCYRDLTLEVSYNDLDQLEAQLTGHPGEIAGIIIEAVKENGPGDGYFADVRRLADEHGAVFILDEVKTGFRFALGGAQSYFGIEPDLATFGKAMCNGYPGSVVVGRRAVMAGRTDTFLAATFHADAISIVAALATIKALQEQDGIAHQWRLGQKLIDGLTQVFAAAGVGLEVTGFPVLASVTPSTEDWARLRVRFLECLIARGVYMTTHPWFLSLAHTNADIDLVLERAELALKDALR